MTQLLAPARSTRSRRTMSGRSTRPDRIARSCSRRPRPVEDRGGTVRAGEAPFSLADVIAEHRRHVLVAAKARTRAERGPLADDLPPLLGDCDKTGSGPDQSRGKRPEIHGAGGVFDFGRDARRTSRLGSRPHRRARHGIGIAPRISGKLFEPFVQAERRPTASSAETGLGLAISKRLSP